jgi:glutamate 5-kinase
MVVPLVGAEALVLLTDVPGVLDAQGRRIKTLAPDHVVRSVEGVGGTGTGGIQSKLDAARKAARSGAAVVIASAQEPDVLLRALDAKDVGTFIAPHASALRARQHWIAFTLRPRGTIVLDAGAVAVLRAGRSSLLPVGVLGVRGQFSPGDAVLLVGTDGEEVARGLTRLGAMDVARAAGKRRADLARSFGATAAEWLVVHKDDLVIAT